MTHCRHCTAVTIAINNKDRHFHSFNNNIELVLKLSGAWFYYFYRTLLSVKLPTTLVNVSAFLYSLGLSLLISYYPYINCVGQGLLLRHVFRLNRIILD